MYDADGMCARSPRVVGLVVGLSAVAVGLVLVAVAGANPAPRLTIAPRSAPVGKPVTVRGYGFRARLDGIVVFGSLRVASFRAGPQGRFVVRFVVPTSRGHRLRVIAEQTARGRSGLVRRLSEAAAGFQVVGGDAIGSPNEVAPAPLAPATSAPVSLAPALVAPGLVAPSAASARSSTSGSDGSTEGSGDAGGSSGGGEDTEGGKSTEGSNGAEETGGTWWKPSQHLTWYLQLQGAIDNNEPVAAYDIDGFENTAAEVSALHAQGKRAVCYIDVGTAENWRSDYSSFPASVLGASDGWSGEQWLDIRQMGILEPIMTARFEMCKEKGFDAVDPDNMDGYENDTGFPITAAEQLTYNEWVATEVHSLGMAVFQKNDSEQVKELQPYFDGEIVEQCNEYRECADFEPYLAADKPVIDIEYSLPTSSFCAADEAAGIMGALYSLELNGTRFEPCW